VERLIPVDGPFRFDPALGYPATSPSSAAPTRCRPGDVGRRAALGRLRDLGRHADEAAVRALAEAWRPYRGFAAFYPWSALQQRER
jgi:hypothetical protein